MLLIIILKSNLWQTNEFNNLNIMLMNEAEISTFEFI